MTSSNNNINRITQPQTKNKHTKNPSSENKKTAQRKTNKEQKQNKGEKHKEKEKVTEEGKNGKTKIPSIPIPLVLTTIQTHWDNRYRFLHGGAKIRLP